MLFHFSPLHKNILFNINRIMALLSTRYKKLPRKGLALIAANRNWIEGD